MVVGAAEGHAERTDQRRRLRRLTSRSRPRPAQQEMAQLGELLARSRASVARCSAAAAGRSARAPDPRLRRALRDAGRDQLSARAAVRPAASLLCGRSRAWSQSQAGRARQGGRSAWCWSAGGSAKSPRKAIRCSTFPRRRSNSSTSIPARKSLAGSIGRILPSTPRRPRLSPHARAPDRRLHTSAWREHDRAPRMRTILPGRHTPTPQPGGVNLGADHGLAARSSARPTRSCATAPAIMRPGSIASIASASSRPISRRPPRPWVMACRRRWRCSGCIPDALVMSVNGDGDFLMNGQEFAHAVQYVCRSSSWSATTACYGTIRMHQEREYPGRVCATDLRNPGFRRLCARLRRLWRVVTRHEDFRRSLQGRADVRPACDHPSEDRPRCDHA